MFDNQTSTYSRGFVLVSSVINFILSQDESLYSLTEIFSVKFYYKLTNLHNSQRLLRDFSLNTLVLCKHKIGHLSITERRLNLLDVSNANVVSTVDATRKLFKSLFHCRIVKTQTVIAACNLGERHVKAFLSGESTITDDVALLVAESSFHEFSFAGERKHLTLCDGHIAECRVHFVVAEMGKDLLKFFVQFVCHFLFRILVRLRIVFVFVFIQEWRGDYDVQWTLAFTIYPKLFFRK